MDSVQGQSIVPAYAGGTINTDTNTSGGITIDTQGYDEVAFAVHVGTVTAGSLLLEITETDNADGTTDAAEVGSYKVQQTLSASNTVKKVATKVNKRYVRLQIDSDASANIVVKSGVAILSKAKNAPVS